MKLKLNRQQIQRTVNEHGLLLEVESRLREENEAHRMRLDGQFHQIQSQRLEIAQLKTDLLTSDQDWADRYRIQQEILDETIESTDKTERQLLEAQATFSNDREDLYDRIRKAEKMNEYLKEELNAMTQKYDDALFQQT